MKRTDIPARIPIMQLVKDNMLIARSEQMDNIEPFCFYTDGGTYNDDYYYFI